MIINSHHQEQELENLRPRRKLVGGGSEIMEEYIRLNNMLTALYAGKDEGLTGPGQAFAREGYEESSDSFGMLEEIVRIRARLLEGLSSTEESQRYQAIKHDVEVLIPGKVRAYVSRNALDKDARIDRVMEELNKPQQYGKNSL